MKFSFVNGWHGWTGREEGETERQGAKLEGTRVAQVRQGRDRRDW